jgi:hypothetical protein
VFAGSVRDHAFAKVKGEQASSLERATEDQWVLKACPHHGPGLARAAQGGYHAVWYGEKQGKAAARYGRLDTKGRPVGQVMELPDARADHADVAVSGERVVITWRSFDGIQTHLRAWVSADGGSQFVLRELHATQGENDHPRLIAQGERSSVVWRTEDAIYVEDVR